MKLVREVLTATAAVRQAAINSWSSACSAYFDAVASLYPQLVETNIRSVGTATLDLLEQGTTDDLALRLPQYPAIPVSRLEEPALRALYEVGAIQIDASGNPVVEPGPAALLRGLARLALPSRSLMGIINAARKWRGQAPLTESQFQDLDAEIFTAVKSGLRRSLGDSWFRSMNRASHLAGRASILPCMPLRGSQEFYEEGIAFYSRQGADAALYIYSTTSGLVIPREFHGDTSKNPYRYRYFTEGILGRTSPDRIYQWERYRTAKELATGYEQASGQSARALYRQQAVETLSRFARTTNLAILEAEHFAPWKEWNTLLGPIRQQVSIRPEDLRGKIGHGIIYDADAFKSRADLLRHAGILITAVNATAAVSNTDLLKTYGAAILCAASACFLLSAGVERLARLTAKPIFSICAEDRAQARVIKPLAAPLSPPQVESIVDDLLAAGRKILAIEKKGDL